MKAILSILVSIRGGQDSLFGIMIRKANIKLRVAIALSLWWNRNCAVQNKEVRKPADLYAWAVDIFSDFQNTQRVFKPILAVKGPASTSVWHPPPGCLKLNSDAAVCSDSQYFGIGTAVRNDRGLVVAAISMPMLGSFGAEMGELLVLREGLHMAKRLNLRILIVEVDTSNIASTLNSSSFVSYHW
ncbi:hypothetical protein Ddye_009687 [Dipteronia dyeriana]|uniref:RNase H type-1 domain-containing protein n=1 Tax=Dipteronia dyeriana TaxID=168575 RepID=A0AAE0CMF9_9ROSI|nr:hypothetical protein Ddye_009687 [Dipteronia dyeriana]